MTTLTIRNLDDTLKGQLRQRATQHGCSMEEEVRRILRQALAQPQRKGFGTRVHQQVAALTGGFELPLPPRNPPRAAPDFGDVQ